MINTRCNVKREREGGGLKHEYNFCNTKQNFKFEIWILTKEKILKRADSEFLYTLRLKGVA